MNTEDLAPGETMRPRNLLVPAYALGTLGALLQIVGGYWDVTWHILGIVETFATPPHLVLYSGIALVLLAALLGLVLHKGAPHGVEPRLLTGLTVILVGSALQLVAGPFDSWWHATHGFDPFLFTAPHSLLVTGIALAGAGMGLGTVRLLQAHREGADLGALAGFERGLYLLALLGLAVLWLGLNAAGYLVTDVDGMAYTFGWDETSVQGSVLPAFLAGSVFFAFAGTLVLLVTKTVLGWRGAASLVAAVVASVTATANLGFRALVDPVQGPVVAGFLPLYLAFLIPVAAFDLVPWGEGTRRRTLLGAALVAPFASSLDGFHSLWLWTQGASLLLPVLPLLLLAGLAAGLLQGRFTRLLVVPRPWPAPAA